MTVYKPFAISNFRSGFNESVEPWLLPRDSFQVLTNAHLYRGVIEKIPGYDIFTKMSYRQTIQLTPEPDGVVTQFTGVLTSAPTSNNFFGQGTTNSGATQRETFVYNGDGASPILNLTGSQGGTGTVNLTTLEVTLNFNTAPPSIMPAAVQYNGIFFTWDAAPSAYKDIMGIKPYYQSNGNQDILIFDTRRVGRAVDISSSLIGQLVLMDIGVTEIPHEVQSVITPSPAFDGLVLTFTGSFGGPVIPGEVTIKRFNAAGAIQETITDNSAGLLTGTGLTTGFINYATGNWTISFAAAPAADNTLNGYVCVYGDVFTGDYTNFFSVINYQSKAFITNNVDAIRYYDGTCLLFLNTNLSVKPDNVITYDISRCLHVFVNRERLLLILPTVQGNIVNNGIYWSVAGDPLDFTNDEQELASTSESIKTFALINSDLVVRFSNSERIFRYTGDAFAPFRWDSTNNIWRCDASFSAINYDSWFSSVGRPAIVSSDGVNVKRADEIIPDFTDPGRIDQQAPVPYIDQTSIQQCYGERFDDFKEGWMCYRSNPSEGSVSRSDHVLAFNYLDGTYAVYAFPFNVLGFGRIIDLPVWGNIYREWGSIEETWGSYEFTEDALVDLAGDQYGNVYQLGNNYTLGPYKEGNVTGVSSASSAVITSTAHQLETGDRIVIQNVLGPTIINNQIFVVTRINANTFSIPFDTTLEPVYVSGGNWFTAPVLLEQITKNFNPFVEEGQLTTLGYVDLLVSANNNTKIRVQFYKDDQLDGDLNSYYKETTLTFSSTTVNSTTIQSKVWKRIYVGAVGKEHTLRIYQNLEDFTSTTLNQPVKIHAIVLYMKPVGRIFN
jgi:hypothetical protein